MLIENGRIVMGVRNLMTRPTPFHWRDQYQAALCEMDNDRMVERIALAQRALIQRARELFLKPGDNLEEEQAIDEALRALRALHKCSQIRLNRTA